MGTDICKCLILFIVCCLLNSCSSNKNKPFAHTTYFQTGEKESEYTVIVHDNETVLHGTAKNFYLNGNLKLKRNYFKGERDGEEIGYFDDGSIDYSGFNKNNEKDSIWLYYRRNEIGNENYIEQKSFYRKGIPVSNQFKYFDSGQIKEYYFYNPIGEGIYRVSYDRFGNRIDEKGYKTPQIVIENNGNDFEYLFNDTLKVSIYKISPPDVKTELYIRIIGIVENWFLLKNSKNNSSLSFEIKLKEKGEFDFETKLIIKHTSKDFEEVFTNTLFNVE